VVGRRLILEYAVLVGIPLLGVAAILRLGQNVTAPPSIGGMWRIEADWTGCDAPPVEMRVKQSGRYVEIELRDHRLQGVLDRSQLSAAGAGESSQLTATIANASMRGALKLPAGCAAEFQAYLVGR
jgi:hypothetical protein